MIEENNSPEDKKNRILQIALEEFAANGYPSTSTNIIAEKAKVSKGMIFHIFSSKKLLYMELLNKIIKELSKSLEYCNTNEDDNFFQMIRKYSEGKLKFYAVHPNEYKLTCEAFYNTPKELQAEIKDLYNYIYSSSYRLVMDKFNKEVLREGIDRKKALEIILSCLDFLEKKYLNEILTKPNYAIADIQEITKDYLEYLDIISKGVK